MIESLITLLGSPLLGGILGSVSALFQKKEERKVLELKYSHEENMTQMKADIRLKELTKQGELREAELDGEAFLTSQEHGNANSGNELLDGIKAMVRPVITIYLLTVLTILGYHIHDLVDGLKAIPVSDLVIMYKDIISSVLVLTTMAVSWWFGMRNTANKITNGA